jgi:hypothetical protein
MEWWQLKAYINIKPDSPYPDFVSDWLKGWMDRGSPAAKNIQAILAEFTPMAHCGDVTLEGGVCSSAGRSYCGWEALSDRTGIADRTLRRNVNDLRAAGLSTVRYRGSGQTAVLSLVVPGVGDYDQWLGEDEESALPARMSDYRSPRLEALALSA